MSHSISIYIEKDKPPTASLNDANPDHLFATVDFEEWPARAWITLRTRAEAELLINAAVTARDLLPRPEATS